MTTNIFNSGDVVNIIPHWNTMITLENGNEIIDVEQNITCIYLSKSVGIPSRWHRILYKDMIVIVHETRIKKM